MNSPKKLRYIADEANVDNVNLKILILHKLNKIFSNVHKADFILFLYILMTMMIAAIYIIILKVKDSLYLIVRQQVMHIMQLWKFLGSKGR